MTNLVLNQSKEQKIRGNPRSWASLLFYVATILALLAPSILAAQSPVPDDTHQAPAHQAPAHQATVSEQLVNQLEKRSEPVSFLVVLADQPDAEQILQTNNLRNADRSTRNAVLYAQLTTHAQRTQAPLRAWLDAQGIAYTPFYIVNMIEVKGDAAVVESLRHRPEIDRLIANPLINNMQALSQPTQNPKFKIQKVAKSEKTLTNSATFAFSPMTPYTPTMPYGLSYTRADAVWARGFTGKGIIIGSQDTGVEWDHPAFKLQYRGWISATNAVTHTYHWFDAGDLTGDPGFGRPASCDPDPAVPCDDQGHGTHTVGTMVGDATASGDTILGMAPGAQWIGCRNMEKGVGTPASYTACFEFFLAPYPQGGDKFTQGRPELAPHIISNSWGCPQSEGCDADSLKQIVETMRSAHIMVVASAGNNGVLGCSTVRDPIAIYDAVFSVGAHASNGSIASFSSRGTVKKDGSNRLKPDISAPGIDVRSAKLGWRTSTNPFNDVKSGTSMAAPHVTGAVALLWSAFPSLIGNIDLTEQILIKSATPVPFNQCGEAASPTTPNNTYGFGRLNILKALELAQAATSVTIVAKGSNGEFITGTNSTLTDAYTGFVYPSVNSTSGTAEMPVIQFPAVYLGASNQFTLTLKTPTGSFPFPITLSDGDNSVKEVQVQYRYFPIIGR